MADAHPGTMAFDALLAALGGHASKPKVDLCDLPSGEHWLDLEVDGVPTNVAYRQAEGYGVYVTDEVIYGAGPDEVLTDPVAVASRLREVASSLSRRPTTVP